MQSSLLLTSLDSPYYFYESLLLNNSRGDRDKRRANAPLHSAVLSLAAEEDEATKKRTEKERKKESIITISSVILSLEHAHDLLSHNHIHVGHHKTKKTMRKKMMKKD